MPSDNLITIATAGSGKTTSLVREALEHQDGKSALITYTRNGASELREKSISEIGYVPEHLHVGTWFTFLLRHFVRPYQRALHDVPVKRMKFVAGRSAKGARKTDIKRFYLSDTDCMYSDKLSQFACAVIDKTDGRPLRRLEQIYVRVYIDEVQDLSGYDLDLLEHLLNSEVDIRMVGDIRQATYKTNNSAKNSQFGGAQIFEKFKAWRNLGKVDINLNTGSFRCVQAICDLADQLYPNLPNAKSLNERVTGHDGVFAVRESDAPAYFEQVNPQTLRLSRRTKNVPGTPMNFGAAKGCTFNHVLIYPHKALLDAIKFGDFGRLGDAPTTIAKVYVGITRARQSVGFVIPDNMPSEMLPIFSNTPS